MAKFGVGCGVLLLIGVLIMALLVGWCKRKVDGYVKDFSENPERAAAEMMVKMNPDLDLVKSDDEAGTITFRDKSGKETTVRWSELKEGKVALSDSEGNEYTLGMGDLKSVPEWVPQLPKTSQVTASHHAVEAGKVSGSFLVLTPMTVDEVNAFLKERALALGMEESMNSRQTTGEQEMHIIGYKDGDREINAMIIRITESQVQVQFSYQDKAKPVEP